MRKNMAKLVIAGTLCFSMMPIQALAQSTTTQTATVVQSVSFREKPSTSGERIRYLQKGETVTVIDKPNSYWLHVKDGNGKTGYISSSQTYITLKTNTAPSTGQSSGKANAEVVASVSFRKGPSTNDARIRFLKEGERITVVDKVNSYWYKAIDSAGVTGYVSTSDQYIELFGSEEDDNEEAVFQDDPNATIVKSVSFRTGPSTDASRIRYLQAGEPVLILQKVNSYWYKIQDKNGKLGYVSTSSSYIKTDSTTPTPTPEPPVQVPSSQSVEKMIAAGMKFLGTPYEYGSSRYDNTTMDCSDLVRQAFLNGLNLRLPGDSRSQGEYVKQVGKTTTDWHNLKRGDLLFFMSYKGSKASSYAGINKASQRITHVAIYLGNGQILHTYSKESGGVRIDNLAGKHWEYRFIFGGSAL
ncbi:SH3 domain-containing C40 family peptidase [Paenibacillus contaminans]|uniref:Hydrolase Nlp/P60 n=1 Tax=Paenibacillus contaminans TaxID=450362 RepID=A0A329MI08_9BACL|nr:SH3 domain-containing C40 family peptidase [Paenibacillus contaminans]RAV19218.1 hydrolase Nlp/P60 [Paenibacillus contaminans]